MEYARTGYSFHSVSTPTYFAEAELPEDASDDNKTQAAKRRRLEKAAEKHGTYVETTTYRRG